MKAFLLVDLDEFYRVELFCELLCYHFADWAAAKNHDAVYLDVPLADVLHQHLHSVSLRDDEDKVVIFELCVETRDDGVVVS